MLSRIDIEGMFWWVRKMMGLEGLCTAVYDDPELVGQMMSFSVDYQLEILRRVLRRNVADYAVIFEDLAYKNGPLISPALVRRLMLPGYRKITSCLRDFGIDVIIVDSDGDVSSVIPIWLEAGINGILPCEVAAGMDVRTLRSEYGERLILVGGIDKRALARDRETIRQEVLAKVRPLVQRGGYFPTVDHQVPYEVSLDNYRYYLDLVRKVGDEA